MTYACRGIYVVGAKRTPFSKYGGYFRNMQASHVFAAAAKGAIYSANIDASLIDCTIIGNVHYLSQCDGGKTPRYCGHYSGVPIDRPALGVNKLCGSGLQALINGAMDILTGTAKICLVGGTEVMSSLPLFVWNVRFGSQLGAQYKLQDPLSIEMEAQSQLAKLAEDIAGRYSLKREDCDEYALESHKKFKKAQETGIFEKEISSLRVSLKKKEVDVTVDEIPVPELTHEGLTKASTLLENGKTVTQANSSVPADGAAALVLADEESVLRHNLTPLARLAGWTHVGCGGNDLGQEDAVAVGQLLQDLKMTTQNVDLFEINERFATQSIAAIRKLKLDADVVNSCGGSLALGNPTAATGSRMAVHIAHRLGGQTGKAVAASSCGVGQGIAILFEKP